MGTMITNNINQAERNFFEHQFYFILIFYKACRGNTIDFGNLVQDGSLRGSETLQMLSSESDVLIAYATTPGKYVVLWGN